ncbi:nucleotidyltransferase family protein [Dyadobacter pollutisoli]|uniref:Nucleotidyltransferase family protein n=1 Tax=Dyadobacter pollutisoli TaxID=2910158 RepID=A0A9E8SI29_9BACT|nr:nucleotidyltransferase family protein [Dyadobacter pollutisoli]WAC09720.1 nucleotidyltransferase family protein [Dyadobacter pollutisoli]
MNRSLAPELSLLVASCLHIEYEERRLMDSRHLFNLLYYHQIRPVFLSYIHERGIDVNFKQKLTNDCQHITFSNMLCAQELVRVDKLLTAKDITTYAYKGSVWADWLYGNVGQREFGDIDLLIPKEDFAEAIEVLSNEAGYLADDYRKYLLETPKMRKRFFRTDYHIPMLRETGDSTNVLEAHWEIAYPRLLFTFPSDEWSRYSEKYMLLGKELNVFQKEYQFLILLVHHGGKEQWKKLKYIADLAAYMFRYGHLTDWEKVTALAKEKGIYSLLTWSLGILKALCLPWKKEWPQQIVSVEVTSLIKQWETAPRLPSNSTWPYFKHGLAIHDGFKHKSALIFEHLKYFSEWQLLWHKAAWYKKKQS